LKRFPSKGFLQQAITLGFQYWKNNQWSFRNKIAGFDSSARYFEITDALEVYVSHEYKGVFRLQLIMNLLQGKISYRMSSRKRKKCQLDKI
jgi:hypothetical protein